MLQAESEKLRQAWIQAVQASIASAYREISDNYYIEVWTHTYIYRCIHAHSYSHLTWQELSLVLI